MAVFTLQQYLNTVGVRIVDQSGGTLTSADIVDFLNEELRRTRREIDVENTRYITPINLMFGIYNYPLPTGYEDFAAITWQGKLSDDLDFVRENDEEMFWRNYTNRNTFCEQRNGKYWTALINLVTPQLTIATVDNCDSFNGNGTWTADTVTSDANNVRTNYAFPTNRKGSVAFDIIPGQSVNDYALISNSGLAPVNLSANSLAGIGRMTMDVFIPAGSVAYTSMTIRWGSSVSDYYEATATVQQDGTPFVNGTKNTVGFDWSTATTTGTPDDSEISYMTFRVDFPSTLSGTQSGFSIDNIVMREVFTGNLHYYSSYIVIDGTTGEPKEEFSGVSDTTSYFSCDDEYVDILTYGILETIFTYYKIDPRAAQLNKERHAKAIEAYMVKFPSQRVIPVVDGYENPPLFGRDWWDNDFPNPNWPGSYYR